MSTTAATLSDLSAVPRRAGRVVLATLFVVMATLLLAAVLIPLLSGPGADLTPRPAPAPAPALPR